VIVIFLAFNFSTKRLYEAWIVACVILPEVSINKAIEEPSGRVSISQIVYQSDAKEVLPLSLFTCTGPNVRPLAYAPIFLDLSLIVMISEVATIVPDVESLLISNLKLSAMLSVNLSEEMLLTTVPVPLLILKEPSVALSVKSDAVIVPLS